MVNSKRYLNIVLYDLKFNLPRLDRSKIFYDIFKIDVVCYLFIFFLLIDNIAELVNLPCDTVDRKNVSINFNLLKERSSFATVIDKVRYNLHAITKFSLNDFIAIGYLNKLRFVHLVLLLLLDV